LHKNCLLKHVIEGKIKDGRGRRRRKQLLNDLKRKKSYSNLKEEALDHILWRTRFVRSYGPVARQKNY
jgi:hypothetical protein